MIDVALPLAGANGRSVAVEALDGGRVISRGRYFTVGADGILRFKFQAGRLPGAYHIALHDGTRELGLDFWVFDRAHPQSDPPVVNPRS